MYPADGGSHHRVSSGGSSRSTSSRSRQAANPQQQLSQIEKSVTHLLVATKQLLETLTSWSRGSATETEVSDVYVRLGYEFNIACRAFNSIGVETEDLGPVPDLLRTILEETLSQEASQASLDKFLPRIRDIIINLLHGLKKKQSRLRQKSAQTPTTPAPGPSKPPTVAVQVPSSSSPDAPPSAAPSQQLQPPDQSNRDAYGNYLTPASGVDPSSASSRDSAPLSGHTGRDSPGARNLFSPSNPSVQKGRDTSTSTRSPIPSSTGQNMPTVAPSTYAENASPRPDYSGNDYLSPDESRDQATPPMQKDALAALQRGGELERRASRRFSAYQIQKHLGTPNGVPIIPAAAQNSPIPNRGNRDAQESMNAVRNRSNYVSKKQTARKPPAESSPLRREASGTVETSSRPLPHQRIQTSDDLGSPQVRSTTEDGIASYPFPPTQASPDDRMSANTDSPAVDEPISSRTPLDEPREPSSAMAKTPDRSPSYSSARANVTPPRVHSPMTTQQRQVSMSSPQPGRELTLFLQYKSKIKKFVLADAAELTVARLQLAFIEKFAWNTQNNGTDLPEIYIQDPVSGVRHELEDLSDIRERSVLVLNIEALDEVKRYFDDGVGSLRKVMDGLRTTIDDQQAALSRLSESQKDAARDIASIAAMPAARPAIPASTSRPTLNTGGAAGVQLEEVQSLRRDLAVVRQVYSSFVSDINSSMSTIRTKAASVRVKAEESQLPNMTTDAGRTYVNNGKKSLQEDSEKIVTAVDDLQDTVEDLRKDVVTRGVRPIPRQLETLSKDISSATSQLKKLKEYLKKEKPIWTKIWEKELQVVCDDRDLLTMQEELCIDLEDDLEKAAATFSLVEQATRQQNMENARGGTSTPTGSVRSTSRTLRDIGNSSDPHTAKNGVLGEVKALQPNHESRLEAIERAEKLRQRELEGRREGEFSKELGSFVTDQKLKKSGGVEEVERLRKARDESTRREVWERQAARAAGASGNVSATSVAPPSASSAGPPSATSAGPLSAGAETPITPASAASAASMGSIASNASRASNASNASNASQRSAASHSSQRSVASNASHASQRSVASHASQRSNASNASRTSRTSNISGLSGGSTAQPGTPVGAGAAPGSALGSASGSRKRESLATPMSGFDDSDEEGEEGEEEPESGAEGGEPGDGPEDDDADYEDVDDAEDGPDGLEDGDKTGRSSDVEDSDDDNDENGGDEDGDGGDDPKAGKAKMLEPKASPRQDGKARRRVEDEDRGAPSPEPVFVEAKEQPHHI